MKRFIYIPWNFIKENGELPEQAIELSRKTHLQIRLGTEDDNIQFNDIDIVLEPENNLIDYQRVVEKNFIQSIDYTNEFIDFDKNFICIIKNENNDITRIYPKLVEKHCLKFRFRIPSAGLYNFDIIDNKDISLENGSFEVV